MFEQICPPRHGNPLHPPFFFLNKLSDGYLNSIKKKGKGMQPSLFFLNKLKISCLSRYAPPPAMEIQLHPPFFFLNKLSDGYLNSIKKKGKGMQPSLFF